MTQSNQKSQNQFNLNTFKERMAGQPIQDMFSSNGNNAFNFGLVRIYPFTHTQFINSGAPFSNLVFKFYNLTHNKVKVNFSDFWLIEEEYEKVKLVETIRGNFCGIMSAGRGC